jgi:hypothetical protein
MLLICKGCLTLHTFLIEYLANTPTVPNYKTFWLFYIRCFHYASRRSVYLSA